MAWNKLCIEQMLLRTLISLASLNSVGCSNGDPWYSLPRKDRRAHTTKSRTGALKECSCGLEAFASALVIWWLTWPSSSSRIPRSWSDHHRPHLLRGSSHQLPHQSVSWVAARQAQTTNTFKSKACIGFTGDVMESHYKPSTSWLVWTSLTTLTTLDFVC